MNTACWYDASLFRSDRVEVGPLATNPLAAYSYDAQQVNHCSPIPYPIIAHILLLVRIPGAELLLSDFLAISLANIIIILARPWIFHSLGAELANMALFLAHWLLAHSSLPVDPPDAKSPLH